MTRQLKLTGAKENFTGRLGLCYFQNGLSTVEVSDGDWEGLLKYYQRSYKAVEVYPNAPERVPGDVRPEGEGSSSETSDDGGEHDPPDGGDKGSEAEGDGPESPEAALISDAVDELDPEKDDDWTGDGFPRVSRVLELLGGNYTLTRKDIEEAAPKSYRYEDESEEV